MYVGTGIFLLVVGAILSFAVRDQWDVADLTMIGYICMAAGALAILLSLFMGRKRPHTTTVDRDVSGTVPPAVQPGTQPPVQPQAGSERTVIRDE